MKKSSLKYLVENWRMFLQNTVSEGISDRKMDVEDDAFSKQNAEDFINFLIKSRQGAILAISLLKKTHQDYLDLKDKPLDSRDYTTTVSNVFSDNTKVITDEQIDKICNEISSLINHIEEVLKNGTI